RDDSDARAALSVGDGEQMVLNHAEQDIAILPVVVTPVLTRHGEWIIERRASRLEAHTVTVEILGGFDVVPLEIFMVHVYYGLPVFGKAAGALAELSDRAGLCARAKSSSLIEGLANCRAWSCGLTVHPPGDVPELARRDDRVNAGV